LSPGTRFQILSPIIRGRKGEYSKTFENIRKDGFVRVRVDGEMHELGENFDLKLNRNIKHNIEIIIDRLKIKPDIKKRLAEDIEISLKESGGTVYIQLLDNGEIISFSEKFSCVDCGISYEELTPRMFSLIALMGPAGNVAVWV